MRIVPPKPTLKPVPRKCSTKPGKSPGLFSGSHSTAWPVSPAMEVNVPHSCAIRPGLLLAFCAFPAREAQRKKVAKKIHARRTHGATGVHGSDKQQRANCRFIA